MMMGPMKKKVVTSVVVTAIILIIIFAAISIVYVSQREEQIEELKAKIDRDVVQRYVFVNDLTAGDVVTENDIKYVDVKGESAPWDSYIYEEKEVDGRKMVTDQKYSIIGRRLKVNANEKTIVTESLFFEEDTEPQDDLRLQEFSMITLPSDLEEGDYIDVRLRYPTGEDYLVIAGEKVYSFGALKDQSNTVFLKLDEEEIIRMGSAIIESYIREGVKLYANKYVDPSTQLFTYDRVNYVELFENARYEMKVNHSGEYVSGEFVESTSEEKVERSIEAIANDIGLNVEETENIKIALAEKDEDTLNFYKDKLVVGQKVMEENYPVKTEITTLIATHPTLLDDIKNKYDVAKLEQERINFLDTNLVKKDPLTGENMLDDEGQIMINDEYLSKIDEAIQNEITVQKTERQQYLLNLLSQQTTTTQTANQ